MRKESQEQETVVRGQREKIQKGPTGNKKFEDEGEVGSVALADEGLDCTVELYMSEDSEERVTVLRVGTQQGGSSKSIAVKSSEFGEGKM